MILKNLFAKHPNLKWQSPKKTDYQDIESGTKLNLQYIYYKELQERDLIKPKELKSIGIICKDGRVGGSILSDLGLVDLDKNKIESFIKNRVVLITGAGGSIGSEICRQILNNNPKCII